MQVREKGHNIEHTKGSFGRSYSHVKLSTIGTTISLND